MVQASDRRQGLILAHKQLWGPWLLESSSCPYSLFRACALQCMLMTGVRLAMCKCMAGWASLKSAYGCRSQLQESRLSSCRRAAVEAWAGCQCVSQALVGGWHQGIQMPVGQKLMKTEEGSPWQQCCLLVSSVVKSAVLVCRAGHCKPQSLPVCGGYW